MKRNLIGILTLVVLSMTMVAGACAQSLVKANVPFAFEVGKTHMPAGSYLISQETANSLDIRGASSSMNILTLARHEEARSGGPRLVFYRHNNQYFLEQVWAGYGNGGMVLPQSKRQKEIQSASVEGDEDGEVILALK